MGGTRVLRSPLALWQFVGGKEWPEVGCRPAAVVPLLGALVPVYPDMGRASVYLVPGDRSDPDWPCVLAGVQNPVSTEPT